MTINLYDVAEVVKQLLAIVGFGIILHYYAFAVMWGIRKGMAKIPTESTTTVNVKNV